MQAIAPSDGSAIWSVDRLAGAYHGEGVAEQLLVPFHVGSA